MINNKKSFKGIRNTSFLISSRFVSNLFLGSLAINLYTSSYYKNFSSSSAKCSDKPENIRLILNSFNRKANFDLLKYTKLMHEGRYDFLPQYNYVHSSRLYLQLRIDNSNNYLKCLNFNRILPSDSIHEIVRKRLLIENVKLHDKYTTCQNLLAELRDKYGIYKDTTGIDDDNMLRFLRNKDIILREMRESQMRKLQEITSLLDKRLEDINAETSNVSSSNGGVNTDNASNSNNNVNFSVDGNYSADNTNFNSDTNIFYKEELIDLDIILYYISCYLDNIILFFINVKNIISWIITLFT